ncbi:MAG: hypothetical protein ABI851_06720 [Saprospiraceae bacterium]
MDFKESARQAGRSTWKWIKRLIYLGIVGFIAWFCFLLFANYSEGTRTGYIVKISSKGVLFKTNEGELNFGFVQMNGNSGMGSQNLWFFSVPSDVVAYQIQKAAESGEKVTLFYEQKYKQLFFRGETEYLVYKIENSTGNSPAVK